MKKISKSVSVRLEGVLIRLNAWSEGLMMMFSGGEHGIYHDILVKRCIVDRCTNYGEALKQDCGVMFPFFRCTRVPVLRLWLMRTNAQGTI